MGVYTTYTSTLVSGVDALLFKMWQFYFVQSYRGKIFDHCQALNFLGFVCGIYLLISKNNNKKQFMW